MERILIPLLSQVRRRAETKVLDNPYMYTEFRTSATHEA
jgi:hypothetical protein